jgi:acyl-CoA synthetase (AMP-forming)/AMP-acid ligase II
MAAPSPSGTRSAQPARMLTDLPCELERSPSRYGLHASAAPPAPPSSNASREQFSCTPASSRAARHTTGTTGRPKGIYYSHRGIYLHTLTMVADLGMRSQDAVMLVTPMFHGQSWGLPQAAVRAAAKVVLPGRYMAQDTKVLVDAMIAEGVTVVNGAPAIFQPMLDYINSLDVKPDLSRARLLSGATEPPLSLMRGLYDTT